MNRIVVPQMIEQKMGQQEVPHIIRCKYQIISLRRINSCSGIEQRIVLKTGIVNPGIVHQVVQVVKGLSEPRGEVLNRL